MRPQRKYAQVVAAHQHRGAGDRGDVELDERTHGSRNHAGRLAYVFSPNGRVGWVESGADLAPVATDAGEDPRGNGSTVSEDASQRQHREQGRRDLAHWDSFQQLREQLHWLAPPV